MKFLVKSGVLFLFLFAFLASTAFAHGARDHSWSNYHWARTANPFNIRIGDNVNSSWQPYFDVAMADWNSSSVLNTIGYLGSVSTRRCPVTTGRVEVCNNRYGQTGWLGVAGITISGNHITGSYVKLNDSYAMNNWTKALVTCQEIGHAFGLGHQDENFNNAPLGSCMDYTSQATAQPNQHPNAHDYQQLETIYNSHFDSFTTLGAMVPQEISNTDFGSPRSWGRAVKADAEGNAVLFLRDFIGEDGKLYRHFTHIYPAYGYSKRQGGQGAHGYHDEDSH